MTGLAALLSGHSAWAESPRGFYVGAATGKSNVAVETNASNLFATAVEGEDDTVSEFHVGYRILRHLGVELAHFETQPGWDSLAYAPAERQAYRSLVALDFRTAQASVVGFLPFGRIWEAYAKGGVAFWHGDANQTLIRLSDGVTTTRSISRSRDDMVFGVGVGANPTPAWHLRFEFQAFEVEQEFVLATTPTTLDTFLFLFDFHFGRKANAIEE